MNFLQLYVKKIYSEWSNDDMENSNLCVEQGFLPTEASILQVEAWGLGGTTALKVQEAYKKREEIFTGQRRAVSTEANQLHLSYGIDVIFLTLLL